MAQQLKVYTTVLQRTQVWFPKSTLDDSVTYLHLELLRLQNPLLSSAGICTHMHIPTKRYTYMHII